MLFMQVHRKDCYVHADRGLRGESRPASWSDLEFLFRFQNDALNILLGLFA